MINLRFGHDDLLRTRFAISPLMEVNGSVEALRDPERFPVHAPWATWARPIAAGVERDLLEVLVPRDGSWYPDFVSPPPEVPHATLDDELARVRATGHDQVAAEVGRAYPGAMPAAARRFLDEPDAALADLVRQMRRYWEAVLEPWWDRLQAAVGAEVAWRARQLAAVGPSAAFVGIHEGVAWAGGEVHVRRRGRRRLTVDLAGRGLLLVPAVFAWPDVWPMVEEPWQPALVYAPAGVADVWAPRGRDDGALEQLLGRGRARVLLALDRPAATHELAARLAASPGGVSEHLGVLRRAGLVVGRREGRRVVYVRTPKGDALV